MAKARHRKPDPENRPELCAGHLLVWTWRKLVAGEVECPVLAREYMAFADGRGLALLEAFSVFLRALGGGARRPMAVGHPQSPGLTGDEARMLRLVAAAQAGDAALVSAHLCWMVRRAGRDAAERGVMHLAETLLDCGVVLPPVPQAPPPERAMLRVCH